MNILLMMMGGIGSRTGQAIPKQYLLARGQPIFFHIVQEYARHSFIDKIVLVSHADWLGMVTEWAARLPASKLHAITEGGPSRSASVYNGLKACADIASNDDVILIHDATHPYVDVDGTIEVIRKTKQHGAATLGAFNYDTVYRLDESGTVADVLPRTKVISGASPEAFLYGRIRPIYDQATEEELNAMTSAGAIALEHGIDMAFVQTDVLNLKITFGHDIDIFYWLVDHFFPPARQDNAPVSARSRG